MLSFCLEQCWSAVLLRQVRVTAFGRWSVATAVQWESVGLEGQSSVRLSHLFTICSFNVCYTFVMWSDEGRFLLGFSSFPSKRSLLFTSRANSLNFSTFHVSELSYLNNYVVMSPVLLFTSLLSVPWSYFEPVRSWRQMVGVRRPTSRCHAPVWWWRHWRRFTVLRSNSHQCCQS